MADEGQLVVNGSTTASQTSLSNSRSSGIHDVSLPNVVVTKAEDGSIPNLADRSAEFDTRSQHSMMVERPVYNQSQFDKGYTPQTRHKKTAKERLRGAAANCMCSKDCVKEKVLQFFPFIRILKGYSLRRDLLGDVVAGFTVGIMQIPQGMAYAALAQVAPIFGLYVSFFPTIFYFFLGTSRQVSLGTFAVVTLMVGATVNKFDCTGSSGGSTTAPPSLNTTGGMELPQVGEPYVMFDEETECKIGIAMAVCFLSGLVQILMGVLRLGFVTIYLSEPLTRGFTTGCALHVFTSQVKHIFGIDVGSFNGAFKLIYTYIDLFSKITTTNVAPLIMGLICIIILFLTKEFLNPIIKRKLKAPFPIELLVVVLGTVASYFGNFETKYHMPIVGEIPTGIPIPRVPPVDKFGTVIVDSIIIGIVAFAISVSMVKMFAKRHNYEVDSNQELLAYGVGNTLSSFFHCFTSAVSLSRSVVQDEAGGVTQIAGLFSASLILIVLFAIGPLFEQLPKCVLAAIIMVALKGMFLQLKDLKQLWKISLYDFLIWIVAFLATAILDVDLGLIISVGFCLLTVVIRTQSPYVCLLGWVPQTDLYKDINVYSVVRELPNIKIIRFEASLYYANAEYFIQKLYSRTGINPREVAAQLAKAEKMEAKKQRQLEDMVKNDDSTEVKGRNRFTTLTDEEQDAVDMDAAEVHHIVLDCTTMGYIDSVGVSTLLQVTSEYETIGIKFYLAGCKGGVRDMLERAGFYDKKDRGILYLSIHDAVLVALSDNPEVYKQFKFTSMLHRKRLMSLGEPTSWLAEQHAQAPLLGDTDSMMSEGSSSSSTIVTDISRDSSPSPTLPPTAPPPTPTPTHNTRF